ncbi:hypothetical protein SODG_007206 [Sodalis praecaptivus]
MIALKILLRPSLNNMRKWQWLKKFTQQPYVCHAGQNACCMAFPAAKDKPEALNLTAKHAIPRQTTKKPLPAPERGPLKNSLLPKAPPLRHAPQLQAGSRRARSLYGQNTLSDLEPPHPAVQQNDDRNIDHSAESGPDKTRHHKRERRALLNDIENVLDMLAVYRKQNHNELLSRSMSQWQNQQLAAWLNFPFSARNAKHIVANTLLF